MTRRRSTAWEALGVAPAHPGEHGAAMSRATPEWSAARLAPAAARRRAAHMRPSASRGREATASAVAPDMTAAIACASKRATRCELGRASQGVRTAQRTIVPCCQTSRWRQVRSRESRAPRGAPHTGRGTAAPRLRATSACGSSAPSCGSNQASATSQASPGPTDLSKSPAGIPA